jgi:hypothetical protein
MSEFKASGFRDEFGNAGPDLVGITTFTSPYYFVPPSGSTAERPSNPPPGMLRFNTDIGRLEVWRGDHWATILGESPNLGNNLVTNSAGGTGTRGVFAGGYKGHPSPALTNEIKYITIETLGADQDFGDLSAVRYSIGATGSRTRGIFAGGREPSFIQDIHIITFASTGNSTDSGSNLTDMHNPSACANETRALFGATSGPAYKDTIEYVTIASLANAQDFGNLTTSRGYGASCSSSIRGFFIGGINTAPSPNYIAQVIDYVTISTTGDSQDFGDLIQKRYDLGSFSNSIRGIIGGGRSPSLYNIIEFITMASTGDAQDFGDLSTTRNQIATSSSPTRGVFISGNEPSTPAVDTAEYITIATIGNAVDFGDLSAPKRDSDGCSNGHGGL